jgi:hypothetical protein
MRVSSCSNSKVDAVEQKDIIWLIQERGVRYDTTDRNLRTEVDCKVLPLYEYRTYRQPTAYPTIFKYLYLVPVIYSVGTPGGFVASGSSLVLPRTAADTRGQYSTLSYYIQGLV